MKTHKICYPKVSYESVWNKTELKLKIIELNVSWPDGFFSSRFHRNCFIGNWSRG